MPFKFAWLVELLQGLENARNKKALPAARTVNPDHSVITQWFAKYDHQIIRQGQSGVAFLSCLFPERCPERSYNVQEKRLSQIFGRALGLGWRRAQQLNQWREKDGADFASSIEAVMADCEFDAPDPDRDVNVEEISAALLQIAANSPFSSPAVRASANNQSIHDILGPILHRLRSFETKWLVRLLLKSFSSVQIPERLTMRHFHFLLPDLLDVQNSIGGAITFLSKPEIIGLPYNPTKDLANALKIYIAKDLTPQLGIMVKRQPFEKARSIKHCTQLATKRLMSVERKYDGEYCQIHVDLSKGNSCVQIFSKSGKDSTQDRIRLHGAIETSLRIRLDGCKIRRNCILEGELLVWKSSMSSIEPFYKIRRHVLHGRRFLGTENDSQAELDESLMIIFYDILLLDDRSFVNEAHTKRRQHLKAIVSRLPGVADICERELINFGSRRAPDQLRSTFARCISQKWEGLVLKGFEDSYLSWKNGTQSIKLKKDYIAGLGETADLCVVGGRRDPKTENELQLGPLRWTTFYLACIDNKEDVRRFNAKPRFSIIDTISHHCISKDDILELNNKGQFCQTPFGVVQEHLEAKIINTTLPGPTELFKEPFVVEVYGTGFDRPSNCSFFVLRFPRAKSLKLHLDRTILDTTTFEELQAMAKVSLSASSDPDSQEDAQWIKRLLLADPKSQYIVDKSQSTSPGKTPRSAATADLSPVTFRRPAPPVFIRTDTQDASMHILPNNKQLPRGNLVENTVTSFISSTTLKRRSLNIESPTFTTTANKRRKSAAGAQQSSMDAVTQVVDSSILSSPSRGNRRPLVEIHNLSPQIARYSSSQPRNTASPKHPVSRSTDSPIARAPMITVNPEEEACAQRQSMAPNCLSTPPKSSSELGKALTNTGIRKQHLEIKCSRKPMSNVRPVDQSAVGRALQLNHCHNTKRSLTANPTGNVPFIGPILISRSISKDRITASTLGELLQRTNTSFTYSVKHFMNEMIHKQGSIHIVLVDVANPEATAKEYLKFKHDSPPEDERSDLSMQSCSKIVFLDYRFLYDCLNKDINLALGKKHFSGYINVGPGFNSASDVCWDWRALMNPTQN